MSVGQDFFESAYIFLGWVSIFRLRAIFYEVWSPFSETTKVIIFYQGRREFPSFHLQDRFFQFAAKFLEKRALWANFIYFCFQSNIFRNLARFFGNWGRTSEIFWVWTNLSRDSLTSGQIFFGLIILVRFWSGRRYMFLVCRDYSEFGGNFPGTVQNYSISGLWPNIFWFPRHFSESNVIFMGLAWLFDLRRFFHSVCRGLTS